ncbi:hypothetical protein AcW1_010213 [Taiwanofungus camphoratus]|nr:hypothetical protein AcW1_010213 [Antrodia cinnamomea]
MWLHSSAEALTVLADLHGHDADAQLVQLEFAEIQKQVASEREGAKSYWDLVKPGIVRSWVRIAGVESAIGHNHHDVRVVDPIYIGLRSVLRDARHD